MASKTQSVTQITTQPTMQEQELSAEQFAELAIPIAKNTKEGGISIGSVEDEASAAGEKKEGGERKGGEFKAGQISIQEQFPSTLQPENIYEYHSEHEPDNDDEDESDDEDAFKKLEREINTDKLLVYHPNTMRDNYREISTLCKIVVNKRGNIVDELHKTVPFLTKYEYARVVGIRAKQINNGADPFIEIDSDIIDGYTIAKMEVERKILPFIIARPMPNGAKEYWRLKDLELVHF